MKPYIHHTALVSPEAKIGENVEIGPYSIIHPNVVIGSRTKIGAYCELGLPTLLGDGSPLVIGTDSMIRSYSTFYESSSFGNYLVTGHRVVVREKTRAGVSFQIGTACEIQGDCSIGDHVRFQSDVFVGKKTVIGNFVWALPDVVLTNDPTPPSDLIIGCTIEDYVCLSADCLVLPGVVVGKNALVAAKACVTKNVPEKMLVAGVPAKIVGEASRVLLRDGSKKPAYPWTQHFFRGYPNSVINQWKSKSGEHHD